MYTICYIAFSVLSTAAAFKNDKGNQMHFTDNQHGILCRFYYSLFTHNENAKTGYSFCYILLFWRRVRDSAHFVRPRVCSANYPIVDFFWQDFVLQKIVRVLFTFVSKKLVKNRGWKSSAILRSSNGFSRKSIRIFYRTTPIFTPKSPLWQCVKCPDYAGQHPKSCRLIRFKKWIFTEFSLFRSWKWKFILNTDNTYPRLK